MSSEGGQTDARKPFKVTTPTLKAGGRATEAGMSFQAVVGTWFAAHLISDMPVGSRFGLVTDARPVALQFETGDALDDMVLRLTDGGTVYVQCKTRPGLEARADSDLGKTIAQLVRFLVHARARGASPDPTRVAAVLAIANDAPRSLDKLEEGCRNFDMGGQWQEVVDRVAENQRNALNIFANHVRGAWRATTGSEAADQDLVDLARLFRVRRFGEDLTSSDWREASNLIGSRLFGGEEAGGAPTLALLNVVRQLIRSGAAADRTGLVRALRTAGHADTCAPGFDDDVERLRKYSKEECERLARHTRLPIGGGVPLNRRCLPALGAAVDDGSLLVIGEPGAGKTGVLVVLATRLVTGTAPFVFFSVERLINIAKYPDFREALELENDLLDVLEAWPGVEPGIFIIDALDASRGGPSEVVFTALIQRAVVQLGERWSVVASIRTFDLLNGRRFREAMQGEPPNPDFADADPKLKQVRHFRIPRLSDEELSDLGSASPSLGELVTTSPPKLKALLANIFNLSLAAELIESGVASESIRTAATQSELIDRYEDERLPTRSLQRAAAATVEAMVQRRQLTVRQSRVQHDAVDQILQNGVLVRAGDLIAFAHHVLFDHIAGRFYLEWDEPERLQQQVSGDAAIGLLLGPALRFAMERIWQSDKPGRPDSWGLLLGITESTGVDPIVASVAFRTVADRVENLQDIGSLTARIQRGGDVNIIGKMLSRLARFISMSITERGGISTAAATAWASLAEQAASRGELALSDGVRFLLWTLSGSDSFSDQRFASDFGSAARALLALAWRIDPEFPPLSSAAIRFVVKSFRSDPVASRALLQRILEEPRFTTHAHDEAPQLAEGIGSIIPYDPEFAARIYAILFGRSAPQEGKTWLGGHSRILALSSNRQQDYEHGRWLLVRALKPFLQADPKAGVTAVIDAAVGIATPDIPEGRQKPETIRIVVGARTLQVVDDLPSLQDWRVQRAGNPEDDVLEAFVDFLRTADSVAFRVAVEVALDLETNTAVWARLLGVAAERLGVADDLLWPVVVQPRFVGMRGVARDAIIYLAAVYPSRPLGERALFEKLALAHDLFPEEAARNWWRALLSRFLSVATEVSLATDEMRALRLELQGEGCLQGNPPFFSIQTGWDSADDIIDGFLARDGVDLESEPDRTVRAASRSLEEAFNLRQDEGAAEDVGILWRLTRTLVEAIDKAKAPAAHPQLLHASWGAVSNAVERIANSSTYDPNAPGQPSLVTLLALIERLSTSPYPEHRDNQSNGMMAWGNWDVRVYAASSLMALARRFAGRHPEILDRLEPCLSDPAPTVRLKVADALNTLWDVNRERMWSLVTFVAEHEENNGVLGFFIAGPLHRLAGGDADRSERLLSAILNRLSEREVSDEKGGEDNVTNAAGNLVAWLYVKASNQNAWTWIVRWSDDLLRGDPYFWALLAGLRGAFFIGYRDDVNPEGMAMRGRAQAVLNIAVTSAVAAMNTAKPILRDSGRSETERKEMEALYIAGERLLDQSCNQLYFGSGAFQPPNNRNASGLVDIPGKKRFLDDYRTILDQIGQNGGARTIHSLINLYAYLADAAPDIIFDQIAAILVGPATEANYQFESLGADALVALVRRYLADYRAIFEDQERRARLVAVLELFSSVGWPDALRLLYELPDLLR